MGVQRDDAMLDEGSDGTLEELRDFLEADLVQVDADPAFKERLRKKLWDLVQIRSGRISPRGDDL